MRYNDRLEKALYYLAGFCFLVLFGVNVLQIFLRTFTSSNLLWVVDFSQFLFVWTIMLGTAVALRRNEHLLVSFVKEKLSRKGEYTIDIITRLLLLIFYLVLVVTGIEIANIRMSMAYVTLGWPTGLAYWALPITGVFMVWFTLESIIKLLKEMFQRGSQQSANHGANQSTNQGVHQSINGTTLSADKED